MTEIEFAELKVTASAAYPVDPEFALLKWGSGTAVGMNEAKVVDAAERIYTFGLAGCVAAIAKRGNQVMLAHQNPVSLLPLYDRLKAFDPEYVTYWIPRHDGFELPRLFVCLGVPDRRLTYQPSRAGSFLDYVAGLIYFDDVIVGDDPRTLNHS